MAPADHPMGAIRLYCVAPVIAETHVLSTGVRTWGIVAGRVPKKLAAGVRVIITLAWQIAAVKIRGPHTRGPGPRGSVASETTSNVVGAKYQGGGWLHGEKGGFGSLSTLATSRAGCTPTAICGSAAATRGPVGASRQASTPSTASEATES